MTEYCTVQKFDMENFEKLIVYKFWQIWWPPLLINLFIVVKNTLINWQLFVKLIEHLNLICYGKGIP